MPRKGTRALTPSERANIVIARETRGLTGKTNADIADDHGISVNTVNHMHAGNLPAEARKIYLKKKKRLEELSLDATIAALEKGKELIAQADHPKYLQGVAAMGKMSDTVHRLETGRPTEITESASTEAHALHFIRFLLQKTDLASALDGFDRANLEPLVPADRKAEIRRRIESGELKLLPAGEV